MPAALRIVVFVAVAVSAALAAAGRPAAQQNDGRIVAIGDIHGALESMTAILQSARLIDAQHRWIAGRTRLVQTGDFLDRGASVREVMELLMRLEDEARRAGGRVEVLFGNHEGMNVLRDVRDVSTEAFTSFVDRNSESRRVRAFTAHATIARRAGEELNRTEWFRKHPPGFIEYLEALGPSGRFGRWIRSRKVVTEVDGTIFMHAGIPVQSASSLEEINRTVEREIRAFDAAVETLKRTERIGPAATLEDVVNAAVGALNEVAAILRDKQDPPPEVTQEYVQRLQAILAINQWTLTSPDGPLWYRGYATLGDEAQPQIDALLERLGVTRVAVGHTPQLPGTIKARFNNRVFLMDTGMLSSHYKGGRPAALEIAGGRVTAIYTDGRQPLVQ